MTQRNDPTADGLLREAVRARYAAHALTVLEGDLGPSSTCCGTTGCADLISSQLYDPEQVAAVPEAAVTASLGCGNPTALATLTPGDVVLDLGSGGGIDVLLAAQRVGPAGRVYGLDLTDEMLALAEQNRARQGATNVSFLQGDIAAIPLPDATVDVVISNCVINLAADKGQVLREAYRVLKPGGRLAVADVVVQGELPADVRRDLEAWVGCVAGALTEPSYRELLHAAGFEAVRLDLTQVYDGAQLADAGCCGAGIRSALAATPGAGRVVSAFVSGQKPTAAPTAAAPPASDRPL